MASTRPTENKYYASPFRTIFLVWGSIKDSVLHDSFVHTICTLTHKMGMSLGHLRRTPLESEAMFGENNHQFGCSMHLYVNLLSKTDLKELPEKSVPWLLPVFLLQ